MHKIVPHLWYNREAVEAAKFYVSVFAQRGAARIISTTNLKNTPSGSVDVVVFEILGQEFMAISAGPLFTFNESVSFVVRCDTQEEIDYYWSKLSAVPEAEQCGWLKDRYGLSWQIVPAVMDSLMQTSDSNKLQRVTEAFLTMKKFNIAELVRAAEGQ